MNRTAFAPGRRGTGPAAILVAALGVAACDDPTTAEIPQLNLDRPVDVAFGCYGDMNIGGQKVRTAQPVKSCDDRPNYSDANPAPAPLLGTAASWYAFVVQSAPGTVALAKWPTKISAEIVRGDVQVLDADPLTPGKNSISVGEEPIAIATDRAGCYAITANSGSCDLSALEINSAVDEDLSTPVKVSRLGVKNATGVPILARPAAMVFESMTTTLGLSCPATPTGLAYIAYPACALVAAVDVSTGTIVAGIDFTSGAPVITDGNVTCSAECGAAGMAPKMGVHPVTLAIQNDATANRRRLAIGAEDSGTISVIDLDAQFLPSAVPAPLQIAFKDPDPTTMPASRKFGVTSIALSPQLLLGGQNEFGEGDTLAQYVYAVTSDGTVRVADVFSATPHECETQADLRFVRAASTPPSLETLSCMPIDAMGFPRRAGARGPGIELTEDGVPVSVAFVAGKQTGSWGPFKLTGYFAVITASSGRIYVANVDDDKSVDAFQRTWSEPPRNGDGSINVNAYRPSGPIATNPVLIVPHQLRDQQGDRSAQVERADDVNSRTCTATSPSSAQGSVTAGGPRGGALSRIITGGPISDIRAPQLPFIRQVECALQDTLPAPPVSQIAYTANLTTRDTTFPDLRSVRRAETWTVTWEGPLSTDLTSTSVDGPQVRHGQLRVDTAGLRIVDLAKPFCEMGVEKFDSVQLRGCNPSNNNNDCPVGYECFVHPQSQVSGLGSCLRASEADRLASTCRDFLTTSRTYSVDVADTGLLKLVPRKHVLRTTPIDGCEDDTQCERLADYAVRNASTDYALSKQTATDPKRWVCATDDTRPAVTSNKRCVMGCDTDTDCDVGSVCEDDAAAGKKVCVEGVIPPQECINGPQRYIVRATDAFTVIGSVSGYVHSIVPDMNDHCVRKTGSATSVDIGRIPLKAEACSADADPITGATMAGFEANPCSHQVTNYENLPQFAPGTCGTAEAPDGPPTFAPGPRTTTAIQFRNRSMKLDIVDPVYPGDQVCVLDRGGHPIPTPPPELPALPAVPLVFPGYQIQFSLQGGYNPLQITTEGQTGQPVTFPIKTVAGPGDSIWILDDGDFLSTSIGAPSSRGRVFRIETIDFQKMNLLE